MKLGNKIVEANSAPYIIAEIGVNHEGSMDCAKRLIELAKEGGADAAKFQSYKAEKLASVNSPAYWDLSKEATGSQYQLFKKLDSFGEAEYRELAEHCQQLGIDFISTPFDLDAVEFLNPIVPFFKIASADITNLPLMQAVARTGKPVVLSVGAARIGEVAEALSFLQEHGCNDVVLLHCVLNYPTPYQNAHLRMIDDLKSTFPDCIIGYSDHTPPDPDMFVLGAAYAKGAVVLEKHFTHDKTLAGNDHYHAMDRDDLLKFCKVWKFVEEISGDEKKEVLASEGISRLNARRSLVAAGNLKAGAAVSEGDLICKRPGTGISPRDIDWVLRSKLRRDIADDEVLQWGHLDTSALGLKVVGVIQARMGSSRFPGKAMASLGERPVLAWVLERMKCCKELDALVLAIPGTEENSTLRDLAEQHGIAVVEGGEEDVLERVRSAASLNQADVVVRICADNPMVDSAEVDRLVKYFRDNLPEYAFNHIPREDNQYVDGLGAECIRYSLLEELARFCGDAEDREHVTSYIWKNKHAFNIGVFEAPTELAHPEVRLDIDTEEDLAHMQKLVKGLDVSASAAEIVQRALQLQ